MGVHRTEVGFLHLTQGFDSWSSQKFTFGVAEIYPQRWLEEGGQRIENVDQTHLVLASGKLVLQKTFPPAEIEGN